MKKTVICIVCIIIIALCVLIGKYHSYQMQYSKIKKENLEYEYYKDREIYGTDLLTVINKAIDNNTKSEVEKDNDGFYIANDINSINVDIKITDNNTIYKMETIYNGGGTNFVQYYSTILFKCVKIEYNKHGRISYMMFEQISQ